MYSSNGIKIGCNILYFCKIKASSEVHAKKMNIMQTINITAYTDNNSQIEEIKSAIKKLGIKFEMTTAETPYNPEFVNSAC